MSKDVFHFWKEIFSEPAKSEERLSEARLFDIEIKNAPSFLSLVHFVISVRGLSWHHLEVHLTKAPRFQEFERVKRMCLHALEGKRAVPLSLYEIERYVHVRKGNTFKNFEAAVEFIDYAGESSLERCGNVDRTQIFIYPFACFAGRKHIDKSTLSGLKKRYKDMLG